MANYRRHDDESGFLYLSNILPDARVAVSLRWSIWLLVLFGVITVPMTSAFESKTSSLCFVFIFRYIYKQVP